MCCEWVLGVQVTLWDHHHYHHHHHLHHHHHQPPSWDHQHLGGLILALCQSANIAICNAIWQSRDIHKSIITQAINSLALYQEHGQIWMHGKIELESTKLVYFAPGATPFCFICPSKLLHCPQEIEPFPQQFAAFSQPVSHFPVQSCVTLPHSC